LNLLKDLQQKLNLTYLFISHDLAVVEFISTGVAVMYVGQIVELSGTKNLLRRPRHPYTEALLSAVPRIDGGGVRKKFYLGGEVADPANPPSGCYFHPRCRYAEEVCKTQAPPLREIQPGRCVRCHLAEHLKLEGV
jgi:peptide/nickel transport system ATP-binding protein